MTYRVWVISRDGEDDNGDAQYHCVVHYPTQAGNNAAGLAWSQVLIYNKKNVTELEVGAAPTNLTQAEFDAIVAATKIECAFAWTVSDSWDETHRLTDLHTKTREAVAAHWTALEEELHYYGLSVEYND